MIITCPHCQTKYQVTFDAIGSAGRKVQCAHCHRDWQQAPLPPAPPAQPVSGEGDKLYAEMDEDRLDEVMAAEELAVKSARAATAPTDLTRSKPGAEPAVSKSPDKSEPTPDAGPTTLPSKAEQSQRQKDFSRRQTALVSRLPLARLRRTARLVGAIVLAGLVAFGYFGRVQIVQRYPDMAGVYERVGLGVNVVGLDFSNVNSQLTSLSGRDVLTVSAQIVGLMPKPKPVPPVVVSLLDASGQPVYEWSVRPRVQDLMAGERATFDTQLSSPPANAVHVRLSFAGGSTQPGPTEQKDAAAEAEPVMADAETGYDDHQPEAHAAPSAHEPAPAEPAPPADHH